MASLRRAVTTSSPDAFRFGHPTLFFWLRACSCFFFTTDVSAPIQSTHHLLTFLGEFPGLGLALEPDVHAFVTSRIDCCCSLLAGLPLGTLARLDRVLRSAARLVAGLSKFSSITAYMRDVLHWLPISERIQYRITAMVSRCVLGCAPSYLRVLCCPVSVLAARRVLRSAARREFLVPRAR